MIDQYVQQWSMVQTMKGEVSPVGFSMRHNRLLAPPPGPVVGSGSERQRGTDRLDSPAILNA
jgi:hypothetical protein